MMHDVIITVGDPDRRVRDSMLRDLSYMTGANTKATGLGQYGEHLENSGVLIFTEQSPSEVARLRVKLFETLTKHDQEAGGFVVIPAGSALLFPDKE